ncbi:MAG: DUF3795 domain-containing protein [Dehalococcoidales bacterium]|jgi:hypothetical protein
MIMLSDLIAVCGFDCSNCPAYKATQSNDEAERKRVAEKWDKATGTKHTVEDILCDGCRAGGRIVTYCATCNIRTCAQNKGYLTCVHCPECPCDKIVRPGTREMLEALKKTL